MSKTSRCSLKGKFLKIEDPEKAQGDLYEKVTYIPLKEIRDVTTVRRHGENVVQVLLRLADGTEMDFYYSPDEAEQIVNELTHLSNI